MVNSRTGSLNVLSTFLFILCDFQGFFATSLTRERTSQEARDPINSAYGASPVRGYGAAPSYSVDTSGISKDYNKYGRTDIQSPFPLKVKSSIKFNNVWNISEKRKFKWLFIHKPHVALKVLKEKHNSLIYHVTSSIIKEKKLNKTNSKRNCDNSVLCNICLKVLTEHLCLSLFTSHGLADENDTLSRFQMRKLLQEKSSLVEKDTQDINESDADKPKKYMSSSERTQNLSQLIEELKRDVSKEPVWAMISVSFLMVVLVLAGKVCGMKARQRDKDIHIDVEHDFHNVSVMEVIRLKKRYLPKGFYRLKRKLRRKLKQKQRWIKEKDISEPLTDSSGEERLLYDRSDIL